MLKSVRRPREERLGTSRFYSWLWGRMRPCDAGSVRDEDHAAPGTALRNCAEGCSESDRVAPKRALFFGQIRPIHPPRGRSPPRNRVRLALARIDRTENTAHRWRKNSH